MPSAHIIKKSDIIRTARVMQLEGIFDVPPSDRSIEEWKVDLPVEEKPWNIGLIVGPSGCGKSTIVNELFKSSIYNEFVWNKKESILDSFPKDMSINDISSLLSSVGFSSPPSWFRPYHILSTGEKFRVHIARALAESKDLCVIDEFSSVVDRTVAQIGSAAVAKTVRRQGKKLIAVSCHYDIEDWLQPDWVFKPHENEFKWRLVQRRPEIRLEIFKVHRKAWNIFKQHHYLDAKISVSAQCFIALYEERPVAFYSFIHHMNNREKMKHTKRGHRSVCLPDFQGVGIGIKLEAYIASCVKAVHGDFISAGSHPGRYHSMMNSKDWKLIRKPSISRNNARTGAKNTVKHRGRVLSTFRYIGNPAGREEAEKLLLQKASMEKDFKYKTFMDILKEEHARHRDSNHIMQFADPV